MQWDSQSVAPPSLRRIDSSSIGGTVKGRMDVHWSTWAPVCLRISLKETLFHTLTKWLKELGLFSLETTLSGDEVVEALQNCYSLYLQ